MPYAILRFQKRKAGGVAACERHNERKKEAYKSNPDIDMERSKNNYHLVKPPRYTYKKEINRKVAEAGCRTRKDSVDVYKRQGLYGWKVTDCKICFEYGLYYSPGTVFTSNCFAARKPRKLTRRCGKKSFPK